MTFLERSRNIIFWSLDVLKNNSVKAHYKEVKFINENPNDSVAIEKKNNLLLDLIAHAQKTTKFYSKINSKTLEDFPVVDKNIIINQFDDFMSSAFNKEDLDKSTTSGSTGVPFEIYKNSNKLSRNSADVIYFSELAYYEIGSQLVYVRLWDKKFMKSKFEFFSKNIVPHNILENSQTEIIRLLDTLKKSKSKKTLMIYPSFLEEMCKHMDTNTFELGDFNVRSIIATSEKLNDYEKEKAQLYFNCPIYGRYSNADNGIIAQNTINHTICFQVNHASYYVEILDVDTNKHVKNGEVGKIVVTDLFNFSMPFIRYDTGDLAEYKEMENGYPVFSKIYGRRMDSVYNTAGKFVSPHIFYKISHYSKLKQYQFIQNTATSYTFKLNATKKDTQEEDMTAYFKNHLGDDATFSFEYVDEIMQLASGKRKKVVNLMS